MSQEDVDVIRESWAAADDVGLEVVAERYWDADIEYVEDPQWPGASTYKGRAAVVACFQEYEKALAPGGGWSVAVDDVIDAGDQQVAVIRARGLSASGVPHEHRWGYVVETSGGRLAFVRAFYDPADALKAVGLRE